MQHPSTADVDGGTAFAATLTTECLGTRISRLHRVLSRRYEEALRPLGLGIAQLEVLSHLVLAARPVRPSDLAAALLADRSTVSRNLLALQERGWVRTASTSATGRSMTVAATADGASALAAARTAWTAVQTDVGARLGNEASATLDTWLTAVA